MLSKVRSRYHIVPDSLMKSGRYLVDVVCTSHRVSQRQFSGPPERYSRHGANVVGGGMQIAEAEGPVIIWGIASLGRRSRSREDGDDQVLEGSRRLTVQCRKHVTRSLCDCWAPAPVLVFSKTRSKEPPRFTGRRGTISLPQLPDEAPRALCRLGAHQ